MDRLALNLVLDAAAEANITLPDVLDDAREELEELLDDLKEAQGNEEHYREKIDELQDELGDLECQLGRLEDKITDGPFRIEEIINEGLCPAIRELIEDTLTRAELRHGAGSPEAAVFRSLLNSL